MNGQQHMSTQPAMAPKIARAPKHSARAKHCSCGFVALDAVDMRDHRAQAR